MKDFTNVFLFFFILSNYQIFGQEVLPKGDKLRWYRGCELGYTNYNKHSIFLGLNYQYAGFLNEDSPTGRSMKWMSLGPYFNLLGDFSNEDKFDLGAKIGFEFIRSFPSNDFGLYTSLGYEYLGKDNSRFGGDVGIHFLSCIIAHIGFYEPIKKVGDFQQFRLGFKINFSEYFAKATGLDQGYF